MNKKCYLCEKTKPREEFYKDKTRRDGHSTKCKECAKTYVKKWVDEGRTEKYCPQCKISLPVYFFSKNSVGDGYQSCCKPCKSLNRRLSKYGLSQEDFYDMAKSQDYKCAICKETAILVVDHCHTTEAVRGLLCNPCNLALGLFKDETDRLLAAAKYLG